LRARSLDPSLSHSRALAGSFTLTLSLTRSRSLSIWVCVMSNKDDKSPPTMTNLPQRTKASQG